MSYPKMVVYREKLTHNIKTLKKICDDNNIKMTCVTKVFCANKDINKIFVEAGIKSLADSRIENLINMKNLDVEKLLLRLPMQSQVEEVVEFSDASLNSEISTIEKINKVAIKKGKVHKVILMKDLGDLREGIFSEELFFSAVEKIIEMKGVCLYGIGVNLTCYGGIIPQNQNLGELVELKDEIKKRYNIDIQIVSGGNSSSFYLLNNKEMPKEINHLRLGEIVVLGRETAYGNIVEGLHEDVFELEAEIIEIQEKPSIPVGKIGMDAFGNVPTFEDRGIRKRAIVAVGRQDVFTSEIEPKNRNISILGQSSDHTILDITDVKEDLCVGDIVTFKVSYGSILTLSTSNYVEMEIK